MSLKGDWVDQKINVNSEQTVVGHSKINYETIEQLAVSLESQKLRMEEPDASDISNISTLEYREAWSPQTTCSSGSSVSMGKEVKYYDGFVFEEINKIRNKLDEFLDGSNYLIKVMNPQTIREMVREMRHEIRELKKEHGVSELDIVNYLEEEVNSERDYQATKQDYKNRIPF